MNRQLLFVVVISTVINGCYPQNKISKTAINLQPKCFYVNREVTDTINNVEATLTVKNNVYVFIIKDRKYIPCNLPAGLKKKLIIVSGEILQIRPNERLMGTPIILSRAYLK